jgi:uncharacterized protein
MTIKSKSVSIFAALVFSIGTLVSAPTQAQSNINQPQKPQAKLKTIPISIDAPTGTQKIIAEVAADDQSRQTGMMFRTQMGKNEGMLFIFNDIGYHGMWMQNTLIPLSVAFIREDGTIENIREMQPQTTDPHAATGPVRYALEMNGKWFEAHGIQAGTKIKGLPPAKVKAVIPMSKK